MANLARERQTAEQTANWHLDRVEFFTVKSQSKNKANCIKYHEYWAKHFAAVAELLDELILYRNATPKCVKDKLDWSTRLVERND